MRAEHEVNRRRWHQATRFHTRGNASGTEGFVDGHVSRLTASQPSASSDGAPRGNGAAREVRGGNAGAQKRKAERRSATAPQLAPRVFASRK